jgi:hypothetical protein
MILMMFLRITTTLKVYPGLPHAFYVYPELKTSREYLQTMVDWIEENFDQSIDI